METYFLSDLHLKSINERNGQTLLRFLRSLSSQERPFRLFLLGDIFDLWVSGHTVFRKKYAELLIEFEKLKKVGSKIIFFEGNHDMHLHPYWQDVLGAEIFTDAHYFEINGLTIRCEHGDLINLEAKNYLRLRKTLRHPIMQTLSHRLPGEFWVGVGEFFSGLSRRRTKNFSTRNEKEIVQLIRDHAHRAYIEKEFDLIISGHMHVLDDFEFQMNQKKIRSINLGSWMQQAQVLKLTDNQLEWITL